MGPIKNPYAAARRNEEKGRVEENKKTKKKKEKRERIDVRNGQKNAKGAAERRKENVPRGREELLSRPFSLFFKSRDTLSSISDRPVWPARIPNSRSRSSRVNYVLARETKTDNRFFPHFNSG